MIDIKNELLKRFSHLESLPFLFIGSGISRRYLGLEDWEGLLRKFSTEITGNEFQYEIYENEVKEQGKFKKAPKIAELLERDFVKKYLTDEKYLQDRMKYKEEIQKGISPFKLALAEHFKNTKLHEENEELKILKNAAIKNIAGVITTNYDELLENIFKDYTVYIGQEELIFSNIYEVGEIYKIHGCCSKPESIIINTKDYEQFSNKSAYLTAKLLTIFLEHPIIFMGYSISDENIRNILESISNCLSQDKLNILKDRLIFIEWTSDINKKEISTHTENFKAGDSLYNRIEMTKITTNNFTDIYRALLENKAKYNPKILRNLKKDIYELVKTNNPNEKIKVIGLEESENHKDIEVVIGVGVINDFGKKGYNSISSTEIYKDIIFDDKDYEVDLIVESTIPYLLKHNTGGFPVYKYLKEYKGIIPDKISELKNKKLDDFLNATIRKNKAKERAKIKIKSIAGILAEFEYEKAVMKIVYLNENEININELWKYLKKLLENNPHILDDKSFKNPSELRRIIRIYDWLKYKEN